MVLSCCTDINHTRSWFYFYDPGSYFSLSHKSLITKFVSSTLAFFYPLGIFYPDAVKYLNTNWFRWRKTLMFNITSIIFLLVLLSCYRRALRECTILGYFLLLRHRISADSQEEPTCLSTSLCQLSSSSFPSIFALQLHDLSELWQVSFISHAHYHFLGMLHPSSSSLCGYVTPTSPDQTIWSHHIHM